MEAAELLEVASRGEDGKHQFKANVTNVQSFAEELVALRQLRWRKNIYRDQR